MKEKSELPKDVLFNVFSKLAICLYLIWIWGMCGSFSGFSGPLTEGSQVLQAYGYYVLPASRAKLPGSVSSL